MLTFLILAQLTMFHVTGPDGQPIEVNPDAVAILRPPRGSDHFAAGINCLVFTIDGKYVGTVETCPSVQQILQGHQPTSPTPPLPRQEQK